MSNRAVDVIGLLQELVAEYGEETEVAVAVESSRHEIVVIAVDHKIREADEPQASGPPLIWLVADTLEGDDGYAPPRQARVHRVH